MLHIAFVTFLAGVRRKGFLKSLYASMCVQVPRRPEGLHLIPGTGVKAVNHLMWVLGTEPRSSERTVNLLTAESFL